MSHVEKALDNIRLAAVQPGVAGVGEIAARAGMNIETARRMVRKPPASVQTLIALEKIANEILGDKAL